MLKYAPYSFSRINTWTQCPKKFEYQYIQKIGTFKGSIALDKGKFVHCLLEHSGDMKKVKASSDYKQVKKSGIMTASDYKEAVKIYKDFKTGSIGTWIDARTDMFNELPIAMNKNMEIIPYSNEDGEVIFRGYIDKIIREEDLLILIDYKTGKYRPDMKFTQLMYYGISLFSKLPFDKILMMNVFVEHNQVNKQVLHRADIKKYQKALLTNIRSIETSETWEKNETALCNWCEFQDVCLKETT